jgi:hypothetical protein
MPSTDDMTLPALRRLLRPLGRDPAAVDARAPAARADGLDAMKAVLAEGQDGALIHERALVLVRSGVVDARTIGSLEPWRRTPFIWRERALTGEKISDFLMLHGFRSMTPAGAAVVDAAIADPVPAIEEPSLLWAALFGRQLVECAVDAGATQPRADPLLAALAAAARPPVALGTTRQVLERGRWLVSFECLGQRHAFGTGHHGNRLDVDAVVAAFNALMTHLAHPSRAFRIARRVVPEAGAGASAWLVVTRGDRFAAAARALGIPLATPAPGAKG